MFLVSLKPLYLQIIFAVLIVLPFLSLYLMEQDMFFAANVSIIGSSSFILIYLLLLGLNLTNKALQLHLEIPNWKTIIHVVCILYNFCYIPAFTNNAIEFRLLIPLHLLAMACMAYVLYNTFHLVISIERKEVVTSKNTLYEIIDQLKKNNGKYILSKHAHSRITKALEGKLC